MKTLKSILVLAILGVMVTSCKRQIVPETLEIQAPQVLRIHTVIDTYYIYGMTVVSENEGVARTFTTSQDLIDYTSDITARDAQEGALCLLTQKPQQ